MPTTVFQWRWITVASLLSFVVGIGFFCPRYVLWRGLDIPQARYNPEVHRAYYRLQQIEHPFDPIENENNRAMRWRLLFPLRVACFPCPSNTKQGPSNEYFWSMVQRRRKSIPQLK